MSSKGCTPDVYKELLINVTRGGYRESYEHRTVPLKQSSYDASSAGAISTIIDIHSILHGLVLKTIIDENIKPALAASLGFR